METPEECYTCSRGRPCVTHPGEGERRDRIESAALELFALLKEGVRDLHANSPRGSLEAYYRWRERAEAVIAKAEGEV